MQVPSGAGNQMWQRGPFLPRLKEPLDRANRCSVAWEHMFAKIAILASSALLLWSVAARPSGAHGQKTVYYVKAYDTLWTIASSHYPGDVRDGVWQIQNANQLGGAMIHPGEALVLP